MGYTHYWHQNNSHPISKSQWETLKIAVNKIIGEADKLGIVLQTDDANNSLIVDDRRVNLNGDAKNGLDFESFFFEKSGNGFNFCKTGRQPYDLVVCSVLLLVHEQMNEQVERISSDGKLDQWKGAMELNARVLGHAYHLPSTIDSGNAVWAFERTLSERYLDTLSPKPVHTISWPPDPLAWRLTVRREGL